MVKEAIRKADVLIEALPYIKEFHKKIIVIKYGGSILKEDRVRKSVLEDIAFLKYTGIWPILVHGGGPNITDQLKKLKIMTKFIEGMRFTDHATLQVVIEELYKLSNVIIGEINAHGALARGFSVEEALLKAQKKKTKKDLGYVGDIIDFDHGKIAEMIEATIPIISPIGTSADGERYNINADEVACFLASRLQAEKLVLLTNVQGVMSNPQDESSFISTIKVKEAEELIKKNVIGTGMIPKVRSAVKAIESGVKKAHIIDAKIPHALLLEIFTNKGIGTEIIH
ncbi:MAG: acetylglutamate kinase [Candidatus Omnitrophica bacterium]|nr:acetylglutamate kinase [Candidatus Omnitrophota bacterium]